MPAKKKTMAMGRWWEKSWKVVVVVGERRRRRRNVFFYVYYSEFFRKEKDRTYTNPSKAATSTRGVIHAPCILYLTLTYENRQQLVVVEYRREPVDGTLGGGVKTVLPADVNQQVAGVGRIDSFRDIIYLIG